MAITSQLVAAGTAAVERVTSTRTSTLTGTDFDQVGTTQLFIEDAGLITTGGFSTANLISIGIRVSGIFSAWLPAVFGAAGGAGSGFGIFDGATNVIVDTRATVNGFLITYDNAANRNNADSNVPDAAGSAVVTSERQVSAATTSTAATTTIPATGGGTVVELIDATTGANASNAESRLLTYTIGTGGNAVTRPIQEGTHIPGGAVITDRTGLPFHIVLQS